MKCMPSPGPVLLPFTRILNRPHCLDIKILEICFNVILDVTWSFLFLSLKAIISLSLIFTGTSSSSTMVHTGLSPKNETSDRNCLHRWFPVHSNLLFSFQNNKYNNKRLHP